MWGAAFVVSRGKELLGGEFLSHEGAHSGFKDLGIKGAGMELDLLGAEKGSGWRH